MRISRYHRSSKPIVIHRYRVNEWIRVPEIRVIDENGVHLGILSAPKARALAEERGFDLVEVNPTAQPPIAKLLNYGQFKYEKDKEMKKQKLAAKQIEIKGVRLSLRIGQHDLEIRKNQALKFLEDKNKVRVEIILKGRERQHTDLAYKMINDFIKSLKEQTAVKIEQSLTRQGGKLSLLIVKE